jgi:hypothetical protein
LLAFLFVADVELDVMTIGPPSISTTMCERTPDQTLLPSVIEPMTGVRPAWLVDGSAGR